MSSVDRLRKLTKTEGQSDLSLVNRAQIIFYIIEVSLLKKECVTILMVRLSLIVRNRIIELNDVEKLQSRMQSTIIEKNKEESYMKITRARSFGGHLTMG